MDVKETKSITTTSNNTLDNKTVATENIAFEEEKISAKGEEKTATTTSEEKQHPEDSTTIPKGLIIEEEQEEDSAVVVASNQSSVSASTKEADSDINIQTYSEPLPSSLTMNEDNGRAVLVRAQAKESVLDLLDVVGAKVYAIAKEKIVKLDNALDPNYMRAVQDSRKIQVLGPMVEELARVFEDAMTMISSVSYKEQADFLTGYKKLIKEQINVIDSRIGMAKRLGYR